MQSKEAIITFVSTGLSNYIVLTAAQINAGSNDEEERIDDFYSAFSENVTLSESGPTDGVCVIDKNENYQWYRGICQVVLGLLEKGYELVPVSELINQ